MTYVLRALNFAKVYGFHEPRSGGKNGSVQATTSSGDDLTTTTVNSVSVKSDVVNVKTDTAHVFVAKYTFLGGPLEASNN